MKRLPKHKGESMQVWRRKDSGCLEHQLDPKSSQELVKIERGYAVYSDLLNTVQVLL